MSVEVPKELTRFRNFVRYIWHHLNLPPPTPVQLEICDYLEKGPQRKIIQGFRGVGKSWITSAYVAWLLLMDPQVKVLVVSASKTRSDDFSTFVLRLFADVPLLQHLFPTGDQRASKVAFDVAPANAAHAPSVKSVGIFGQLTGSRANVIIADDVEVPNTSNTQLMRAKLSEAVKEFESLLSPGGSITYLGTPQTEESLYVALRSRGYETRVWPARYPSAEDMVHYGYTIAPSIQETLERLGKSVVGKSTDPKRFTDIDLMEREASYGRSGFALQFQLDVRMSDANRYPLKLADLVVASINPERGYQKIAWAGSPEYAIDDLPVVGFSGDRYHRPMKIEKDAYGDPLLLPYEGRVMTIDPSGRGKDETSYCISFALNGQIFIPDCGGFKGGYDDTVLQKLADLAKKYAVNKIIVEPNFGDGMFNRLLQPFLERTYPCTVEDSERSSTQKEKRIIDTLEPVMNQHRLVVDPRLIKADHESTKGLPPEEAQSRQLFYQLTRITRDKGALVHDDRLDALALAVGYWVEAMGIEQDKRLRQYHDEELDAALKRFMDDLSPLGGNSSSGTGERTWFSL